MMDLITPPINKPSEDLGLSPIAMPAKQGSTYYFLDACRGLAALAVAGYHASLVMVDKQLHGHSTPFYHVFEYGFLGVQLFFVISGYCIAASAHSILRKNKSVLDFIWARLRRIYPTCWASLLLFIIFQVVAEYFARHGHIQNSTLASRSFFEFGWKFWFSNFSLTQIICGQEFINIGCWTLCYEMAFYGLFALVLVSSRVLGGWDGVLWAVHAITCFCLVLLIVNPGRSMFPFDLWPQFGLGILVYDFANSATRIRFRLCSGVAAALIVCLLAKPSVMLSIMQVPSRVTYGSSALFAVILLLLRGYDQRMCRTLPVKALCWIGFISYSLYLTHFLVIGLVNQAFNVLIGNPEFHYLLFCISVFATIAFGWPFFLIAERPFIGARRSKAMHQTPAALAAQV